MRIAYLASRYPTISNAFVLREAFALRRRGVDVHTFSIRRTDPAELLTDADRAADAETYAILPAGPTKVLRAHLAALLGGPGGYLATLGLALRLRGPGVRGLLWQAFYFAEAMILWRECRRRGIRHVHAHLTGVSTMVAMLAARYGSRRRPDAPWSWSFTLHGPDEFYDVKGRRLADLVALADAVVCISHFTRSQLMMLSDSAHWDKLRVIRCGVQTDLFVPPDPPRSAAGPLRVLSIGRLVAAKGQTLIVEAIDILRRRGVDAVATLYGAGPEREALERTVARLGLQDRVLLPGAIGQHEIRRAYADADVFCMSSFAEGLPGVLFEAMAMELPVISTWITGVPELVEDGVSGILVPPARAEELADALAELAADPERRRAMGRAGRAKVVEEFDTDRSAVRLQELFGTMPGCYAPAGSGGRPGRATGAVAGRAAP